MSASAICSDAAWRLGLARVWIGMAAGKSLRSVFIFLRGDPGNGSENDWSQTIDTFGGAGYNLSLAKNEIMPLTIDIKWLAAFISIKSEYRHRLFSVIGKQFLSLPTFCISKENQYQKLVQLRQAPHHGGQRQRGFLPVDCPNSGSYCQPAFRLRIGTLFLVAGNTKSRSETKQVKKCTLIRSSLET